MVAFRFTKGITVGALFNPLLLICYSQTRPVVNDGLWHSVNVIKEGSTLLLQIDDDVFQHTPLSTGNKLLDVDVWVGGYPLMNMTQFVGSITVRGNCELLEHMQKNRILDS